MPTQQYLMKVSRRIAPAATISRVTNSVIPHDGMRNYQMQNLDNNLLRGINSTATTPAFPSYQKWYGSGNSFVIVLNPRLNAIVRRVWLKDGAGSAANSGLPVPNLYLYDLDQQKEVKIGTFDGSDYQVGNNNVTMLPTTGAIAVRAAYLRIEQSGNAGILLMEYLRFWGDYDNVSDPWPTRPDLKGFHMGGVVYPDQYQANGPGYASAAIAEPQQAAMTFCRMYVNILDIWRRVDRRELGQNPDGSIIVQIDPPVLRLGIAYGFGGYNLISAAQYAVQVGRPLFLNVIDNHDEYRDSWDNAPLPEGYDNKTQGEKDTMRNKMRKDATGAYGVNRLDGNSYIKDMQCAGQLRAALGFTPVDASLVQQATTKFEWYHPTPDVYNVKYIALGLTEWYFRLNEFNKVYEGQDVWMSAYIYAFYVSCIYDCHKGQYAVAGELRGWYDAALPGKMKMHMAPLDHIDAGWFDYYNLAMLQLRGLGPDGYVDWVIKSVGINHYLRGADGRGVPFTLDKDKYEFLNVMRRVRELQPSITDFYIWEFGYSRNPAPDTAGNPTAAYSLVYATAGRTQNQRQGDLVVSTGVFMWRLGWKITFYQKKVDGNHDYRAWDQWCDPSPECDAYMRQQLDVMNNATWLRTVSNLNYDDLTQPFVDLGIRADGKYIYTMVMGNEIDSTFDYFLFLPKGGTLYEHQDTGATCKATVLPAGVNKITVRETACYVVMNTYTLADIPGSTASGGGGGTPTPSGQPTLTFTFASAAEAQAFTLTPTPAKYGKSAVFMYDHDDGGLDFYTGIFPYLKGKTYSDGTGGLVRYKATGGIQAKSATQDGIWPDGGNSSKYTWPNMLEMINAGWDMALHSYDHTDNNAATQVQMLYDLAKNRFSALGSNYVLRVAIVPNNYADYINPFINVGVPRGGMTSQGTTIDPYPIRPLYSENVTFQYSDIPTSGHYMMRRSLTDPNSTPLSTEQQAIDDLVTGTPTNPKFFRCFSHSQVAGLTNNIFDYVNNKPGDLIHVPSLREYAEYEETKANTVITKTVSGNTATFKLDQSTLNALVRWRDMSFKGSGGTILSVTQANGLAVRFNGSLVNFFNTPGQVPPIQS